MSIRERSQTKFNVHQSELLPYLARGLSDFAIANAIGISVFTVSNRRQQIMNISGCSSRDELTEFTKSFCEERERITQETIQAKKKLLWQEKATLASKKSQEILFEQIYRSTLEKLVIELKSVITGDTLFVRSARHACPACQGRIMLYGQERYVCLRCSPSSAFWTKEQKESVERIMLRYPSLEESVQEWREDQQSKQLLNSSIDGMYGAYKR